MNFVVIVIMIRVKFLFCRTKPWLLKFIWALAFIFSALAFLSFIFVCGITICMFIPKHTPATFLCISEGLNQTMGDSTVTAAISDTLVNSNTLVSSRSGQAKNFILNFKTENSKNLLKQFLVSLCVTGGALGFLGLATIVTAGGAPVALATSIAASAGIATATSGWMLTSSLFVSGAIFLPPVIVIQVVETGIAAAESSGGSTGCSLSSTVISGVVAAGAVGASVALGATAPEAAAIGAASGAVACQVLNSTSTKAFKDLKSILGTAAVPVVAGGVAHGATKLVSSYNCHNPSIDMVLSVCERACAGDLIYSFISKTIDMPAQVCKFYSENTLYKH